MVCKTIMIHLGKATFTPSMKWGRPSFTEPLGYQVPECHAGYMAVGGPIPKSAAGIDLF